MRVAAAQIGVRGLGASCGPNPCGFWDFFPIPNLFTSKECEAYMVCAATAGHITPTPDQAGQPGLITLPPPVVSAAPPDGSAPGGDFNSIPAQQARCAALGKEWDPLNGYCHDAKTWMDYLPWIAGGVAALVLLPILVPRR